MKHYLEITLLPNPDINLFSLWSKVFQQIHLGLVEMQDEQKRVPIGVSFPEYIVGEKYSVLGGKCRLFAQDEQTLNQLDLNKWLNRLNDYVHVTGIRPVPEKVNGYASYQRVHIDSSAERLARRYVKRHQHEGVTIQQAMQRYAGKEQSSNLPYIQLNSLTNKQSFRLYIAKKTQMQICNLLHLSSDQKFFRSLTVQ
jgi:CRISPR-associated endonuclease Csy4